MGVHYKGTKSGHNRVGTDVQAWDDDLDDIAALTPALGAVMIGDGTDWTADTTPTLVGLLTSTVGTFESGVADTGVAYTLDTTNTFTSGSLFSLENNGTEHFNIDWDGVMTLGHDANSRDVTMERTNGWLGSLGALRINESVFGTGYTDIDPIQGIIHAENAFADNTVVGQLALSQSEADGGITMLFGGTLAYVLTADAFSAAGSPPPDLGTNSLPWGLLYTNSGVDIQGTTLTGQFTNSISDSGGAKTAFYDDADGTLTNSASIIHAFRNGGTDVSHIGKEGEVVGYTNVNIVKYAAMS